MPTSPYSRAEQETIIRWDRTAPTVECWTASRLEAAKLERKGWTGTPDETRTAWRFSLPRRALTIRSAAALSRTHAGGPPPGFLGRKGPS